MSYQPRIPLAFTSTDATLPTNGTRNFTFPLAGYEWQSQQGLYAPTASLTGAHYEYDLLASRRAIKQNAIESLAFVFRDTTPQLVDTAVANANAVLSAQGVGKLWAQDADGTNRWAYARHTSFMSSRWKAGDIFRKPATISFRRSSDWYSPTLYDTTFTINADPKTISIVHAGTARVYNAILIFKGPFSNPLATNANAYAVGTDRVAASAATWVKANAGTGRWYRSTDTGATFAGDYAHGTTGTVQVQQMIIEPGTQSMVVTGANGGTLEIIFYPAYE